jgi:hypothetical protein
VKFIVRKLSCVLLKAHANSHRNHSPRSKCPLFSAQSNTAASTPVFASGLLGQGEVIGLADTGIDMNHCFFHDEDRPTPFNAVDPLHRKVVQYITFDDNSDGGAAGHGTHVAGTLAGNTYVGLHPYAGMAPGAKIGKVLAVCPLVRVSSHPLKSVLLSVETTSFHPQ